MSRSESDYSEMLLRWLAAKRDYPNLEIGPEPTIPSYSPGFSMPYDWLMKRSHDYEIYMNQVKSFWTREFKRTYGN